MWDRSLMKDMDFKLGDPGPVRDPTPRAKIYPGAM